jgi:hypothetical protein
MVLARFFFFPDITVSDICEDLGPGLPTGLATAGGEAGAGAGVCKRVPHTPQKCDESAIGDAQFGHWLI